MFQWLSKFWKQATSHPPTTEESPYIQPIGRGGKQDSDDFDIQPDLDEPDPNDEGERL